MTKLKQRTEAYGKQLDSKVQQLEQDKLQEVERVRKQTQLEIEELEAKRKKRADHLKYFHAHIMKTLKLQGDQYSGQLQARLGDLASQKEDELARVKRDAEQHLKQLELDKQKRADHLKYFHEHIMKLLNNKLKSNADAFSKQLDAKVDSLNADKQSHIEELKREHDNAMHAADLKKQKRLAHLKYFHDHIIGGLKKY